MSQQILDLVKYNFRVLPKKVEGQDIFEKPFQIKSFPFLKTYIQVFTIKICIANKWISWKIVIILFWLTPHNSNMSYVGLRIQAQKGLYRLILALENNLKDVSRIFFIILYEIWRFISTCPKLLNSIMFCCTFSTRISSIFV